jgi:hypothetical protein
MRSSWRKVYRSKQVFRGNKKAPACWRFFILRAFNYVGAPFGFPFFQNFVIATFSFNHVAGVWVLVLLHFACALGASFASTGNFSSLSQWIKNSNDAWQRFLILSHQCAQLCFKLQFLLQLVIFRQAFQMSL